MKTRVGLSHEPTRKLPWVVYWFGDPDIETGKQRKRSKSFRYNREAREFQAAKQSSFDTGASRGKPNKVTLGRLLDEFQEARLGNLSHTSKEGYGNTFRRLRAHFGVDCLLSTINQRQAETFITACKRLDRRPEPLSTWSRVRHICYCRAMFNAAVAWGYLDRNPFKPLESGGSSPLRTRPKSRPWHHITPNEFQRIIDKTPTARMRAMLWLMYGAGLRPGEVYNLTADKVDLDKRLIHIENRPTTDDLPPFTVKADERSDESKERTVIVPTAAIPDLTAAMHQSFKAGGFVVLSADRFSRVQENWRLCRGGKVWAGHAHRPWQNSDMLNNALRSVKLYVRKAGIKLSGPLTLTTFRKSFAQNHADAGTPPKTLAKILGHSDVRITMTYYNRATDANEAAAAQAMDRLFDVGLDGRRVESTG